MVCGLRLNASIGTCSRFCNLCEENAGSVARRGYEKCNQRINRDYQYCRTKMTATAPHRYYGRAASLPDPNRSESAALESRLRASFRLADFAVTRNLGATQSRLTYLNNRGYPSFKGLETPCRVVGAANAESKLSSFRRFKRLSTHLQSNFITCSHLAALGKG